LWFAWKIVLLQYHKQLQEYGLSTLIVVICLKNRTFAVSQTTRKRIGMSSFLLWFAWKIVLLQYRKQLKACYTLSTRVVICLKNRTFAVSQTTVPYICRILGQLWFAWKIVLLQYRKQQACSSLQCRNRCDLLEKSYFCSIANNIQHLE